MIYKRRTSEVLLWAIEDTIVSVCAKYGKAYCYPSQETIGRLLWERHGIKICRRTLNYALLCHERLKSLTRTRQHRTGPDGKILFATTMYTLKKKLFIRLNSMKKWVDRVFPALRVQVRAQHKSLRENEILQNASGDVEILWKSPIEGNPSPLPFHG